jgi:hypothetical protein
VSAALQVALPAEGIDMRAELAECQVALVTQALSRSGGDLTAAAKLLNLTPLELARAQSPSAAAVFTTPARPENPVMKQPPAVKPPPQRPTLVGALPALPEELPDEPEFGRIEKGLLRIDSSVIKRLTVEGFSPKQIARRLGVNSFFVERVQRMLAEPMAKCGPKPRGETGEERKP